MKKMLIISWALEVGGVEKSLIGLLQTLDYSKYQVDLFLCRDEGEWLTHIPDAVHKIPGIEAYSMLQKPIKENLKKHYYRMALIRMMYKLQLKLTHNKDADSLLVKYCKSYSRFLPTISDETYDVVISFLTPHYFASNKVKGRKKFAWIHTDYTALQINQQIEYKMWSQYDRIMGVSDDCVKAFQKVFPQLKDKVITMENILIPQLVREEAQVDVSDEMPSEAGVTRLCTVGRFSTAKAFDRAVEVCHQLRSNGCNVKWYAIGYGGDEGLIRQKIEQYQLEKYFILLGKKMNPYPYMQACDLYIQPSRYEGKAVAVREAQILGKPVIITAFETAPSQLEHGVDGMIVPQEVGACAKAIQEIIEHMTLREQLVHATQLRNYGNEEVVQTLYDCIGAVDTEKVRILHCVGKMNCGGAETMLMNLFRHIDHEQIQFEFLAHTEGVGYYDEEIQTLGGKLYTLPSQGTLGVMRYIKQLKTFLKEVGPFDIVHSHMDWQGGLIAVAARLAGVKRVIVHAHTTHPMNTSLPYQVLLRLQKVCIGICATDYWGCSQEANRYLFYSKLCRASQVKVIPNGIDLEIYKIPSQSLALRQTLGIDEDTLLIGQVGSLSPFKNQLFSLEIMRALKIKGKAVHLVIVGEGTESYKAAIETTITTYQLEENVSLLGLRKDIPAIMQSIDVLIHPAPFEGLGMVILEAQAAGTPCVVSTGVPKEVDMGLDLVTYRALDALDEWVTYLEALECHRPAPSLEAIHQVIAQRKYSIQYIADALTVDYVG